MLASELEYNHEKTTLAGYLAHQEGNTPRPAVLICHAWKGRDQYVCDMAVELAKDGYVGFALDVYGKGVLGQSVEENTRLMSPFMENRDFLLQRLLAGYEALCKLPQVDKERIAVIGYCFGGLCALDLVRAGTRLGAAVSFHGLLQPRTGNVSKTSTKVLLLHGACDPMVSFDDVAVFNKEMQAMQADWQMHIYGTAKHAFTNPQANDHQLGTVYDEQAAKHANASLKQFLQDVL